MDGQIYKGVACPSDVPGPEHVGIKTKTSLLNGAQKQNGNQWSSFHKGVITIAYPY